MSFLFKATAIYKDGQFVFNDSQNEIELNSAEIQSFSPRPVWLLRYIVPGDQRVHYALTFDPSSADLADSNTILGLWVEQNGKGVMIDCISVDNFNSIANSGGTLQRRYGAAPVFTAPTASCYRITRADDGTGAAHNQVVTDYIGQYVGNIRLVSNLSGVSVYEFSAYGTPVAIGSDSIAAC
ncbi:MAG: hypothetical protein KDC56_04425 [Flavobacteriaceae bacterium]|nr:hypothetical protein [Flavobacteriaceae bacterium]